MKSVIFNYRLGRLALFLFFFSHLSWGKDYALILTSRDSNHIALGKEIERNLPSHWEVDSLTEFSKNTSEALTRSNIEKKFQDLLSSPKSDFEEGSRLLLVVNSHGTSTGEDRYSCFRGNEGCISTEVLERYIRKMEEKFPKLKIALFVEACHSGNNLKLSSSQTCVTTSTSYDSEVSYSLGKDHPLLSSLKGKSLYDLYLERRQSDTIGGFRNLPAISTPNVLEARKIFEPAYPNVDSEIFISYSMGRIPYKDVKFMDEHIYKSIGKKYAKLNAQCAPFAFQDIQDIAHVSSSQLEQLKKVQSLAEEMQVLSQDLGWKIQRINDIKLDLKLLKQHPECLDWSDERFVQEIKKLTKEVERIEAEAQDQPMANTMSEGFIIPNMLDPSKDRMEFLERMSDKNYRSLFQSPSKAQSEIQHLEKEISLQQAVLLGRKAEEYRTTLNQVTYDYEDSLATKKPSGVCSDFVF